MKTLFAAALGFIAISASAADPKIYRDLAYSETRNDSELLDIYAPADGQNHPIIVWIHGGGWMRGDKADLQWGATDTVNRKPHAFVERGYVFVSINYRMVPVVRLEEIAGDVAKAISWVHRHAREYGGDPGSMFVMGHSAGAQLAALVCTDRGYLIAEGMTVPDIKGCVPVDGDTYYPELQIDIATNLANKNAQLLDFPDLISQKSNSSVLHAFKGKTLPAFLILCVADHPETHTAMQSEILAEALREAGTTATVVACPGRTHDTLNAGLGLSDDLATKAIFAFLDEQMKPRR